MKPFHYFAIVFASIGALLLSIYIYHRGSEIHKLFAIMELYGALFLIESYYCDKKGEVLRFKGDISILGYYYAGRISRKDDPKRVNRVIFIQKFLGMFVFALGIGLHILLR